MSQAFDDTIGGRFQREALALDPENREYAVEFVARLLSAGCEAGASDLHLLPTAEGLDVRWRIDGVLAPLGLFSRTAAVNVIARLKVLADLLTYKTDVPQEGRIRVGVPPSGGGSRIGKSRTPPAAEAGTPTEMRLSTMPTLYGEKAVVRLFAESRQFLRVADLGLPLDESAQLLNLLRETSGAILIVGPAGGGKTTTAYACLRELAIEGAGSRGLASLEDPIESAIPNVSQSQVNPAAGFDLAAGLKYLLRQDPEVILVGEIRDPATAEATLQAALTGHLVLTTFHAGSAATAVGRLAEMGIAPYLLRSGLLAVFAQRLARRLCDCAKDMDEPDLRLGLAVERYRVAVGCPVCQRTGYRGRIVVSELLMCRSEPVREALLNGGDSTRIESAAVRAGMVAARRRAVEAVARGATSPAEVRRVLGFFD